jgi:hypothetical protein
MNNPYQWNPVEVKYERYPSMDEFVAWWCTSTQECVYRGRYNRDRCYRDMNFPNSAYKCPYRTGRKP